MPVIHKKQWEFLKNSFEQGNLSHSYLFSGEKGIGKKDFALQLAELVGCRFPDLTVVEAEEGKEIEISQIRKIQNFLSYKSYNGGFRAVIVCQAEKMNQEAQNCFLKTLEEPKGNTLIILISSKPDMLLPTIISRCQTIKFFRQKGVKENPIKKEKEEKILKSLLPVLNSGLAEKFKYVKLLDSEDQNIAEVIEVIQKHLREVLLSKTGVTEASFPEFKNYSIEKLSKIINLAQDLNSKLVFTNASPKLALEILLMEF